jgi:predicted dehydrogenase/threonine dehydrogenase-like Zn-dependent dehydrogenase
MKQLIQSYKTGELGLFDVPVPLCLDNGILIRTTCSLISAGTEKMIVDIAKKSLVGKAQARPDLVRQVINKMQQEGIRNTLEKVMNKLDNPIPLGYSCAGIVTESGSKGGAIRLGTRVACGGASYASHSEFNFIPKNLYVPIPDNVDDTDAAFVTVGAIALQGVRQTNPTLGENIIVVGMGLLGQLTVQLLKANGCRVLGTDPDPAKRIMGMRSGANLVCAPEEMIEASRGFTGGHGADAVIITASSKSDQLIYDAGEVSRMKGRVVIVGLVGMNIPRDIYYKKELEVKLSMAYGPGRYDPLYEEHGVDYPFPFVRWTENRNFEAFLNLVSEGKVRPKELITHRFPFADALKAYELISGESKENYLGIVLDYPREEKPFSPETDRIVVRGETKTEQGVIRSGLLGAGNFATSVILPHLKKNAAFRLTALCDASGITAHSTAKKHGINEISTSPDTFLAQGTFDAAFITTRHDSHARFVIQALKAGKNCFTEKPLCLNEEELSSIRTFLETEGSKAGAPVLQVGYNRRFSPLVQKMKVTAGSSPMSINYRINAGIIPLSVWIQDPLVGGGRIIGEVCHFIDTCSFLAGSRVVSVMANVVRSSDTSIPQEDNINILLNYANGCTAHIGYFAYGNKQLPKEFIEVFAHDTAMQLHDFRKLITFHGRKKTKLASSNQDKGFRTEFAAFSEGIRKHEPPIGYESLFNTSMTTFAILKAVISGSSVQVE